MDLILNTVNLLQDGKHYFVTLEPDGDAGWLSALAADYAVWRSQPVIPLQPAPVDGLTVVEVESIQARLREASIPKKGTGNFDIIRSDFGEIIAIKIMQARYGTRVAYAGLRDRELVQLPGRGPDVLGVEDRELETEPLRLAIVEVKVSAEAKCPPRVVEVGEDSLLAQHGAHVKDLRSTSKKLWHLARLCRDKETQKLVFRALLFLDSKRWDKVELIAGCVLVRPKCIHSPDDFGVFKTNPGKLAPAMVRFVAFQIPGEIDSTVREWNRYLNNEVQS